MLQWPRLGAVATVCYLAAGIAAIAQVGPFNAERISIQVRDEAGNPLRGASKVRLEKEDGTLVEESNTDPEGRLQFKNVPRTNLVVIVTREGYVRARERLAARQSLPEIFLSITLARSLSVHSERTRPIVGTSDLLIPHKARREYDKGIAQAKKGDYRRAAIHLKSAAELYQDSPVLWNDLGSNYLRLQAYDQAEAAFRKAINVDRNFAPPFLNLGLLYNLRKRPAEAESLLVHFTELEGHRWQGFVELGNAHFGLGQLARAEEDYRRALELTLPAPPQINVKLASIYVASREFSRALEQYETYLKRDPDGPLAASVREVVMRMKADGVAGNKP